jgi:putative tributyrin esterase
MAFFQCDHYSQELGMSMSMNVVLPDGAAGEGFPVLYLLHGLSDDHTAWMRGTSIERYAAQYGIAVVMPNGHRSFYMDMKQGLPYWQYISEEVPSLARSWFPISAARERNFAAGLSMGGYGAFKLVLQHPERFAAGASLSGALDMANRWAEDEFTTEFQRMFGSRAELTNSGDDLMFVAERLAAASGEKPKLFQCCGTEDWLYDMNVAFRDHVRGLGLDLAFEEGPGEHEWGYWDANIQRVLEWLPIPKG